MTLPRAFEIFEYWREVPPENESLAMMARVFTTWEPDQKPMTQEQHQKSLELRWKNGAMNIKQMFEAMGGGKGVAGSGSMIGANLPGIGPFPGNHTVH